MNKITANNWQTKSIIRPIFTLKSRSRRVALQRLSKITPVARQVTAPKRIKSRKVALTHTIQKKEQSEIIF